jgi:hypothetical protein
MANWYFAPSETNVNGLAGERRGQAQRPHRRVSYHQIFLNLMFMTYVRLVSNLGLKTSLDRYGVPREDLPTIAERALRGLGGKDEIHGDVVGFLEALYSSP